MIVGTGNDDVGAQAFVGPKAVIGEREANDLTGSLASVPFIQGPLLGAPARDQGAMSQQGLGSHRDACYPQKLVHLVGYRDPRSDERWARSRVRPSRDPVE